MLPGARVWICACRHRTARCRPRDRVLAALQAVVHPPRLHPVCAAAPLVLHLRSAHTAGSVRSPPMSPSSPPAAGRSKSEQRLEAAANRTVSSAQADNQSNGNRCACRASTVHIRRASTRTHYAVRVAHLARTTPCLRPVTSRLVRKQALNRHERLLQPCHVFLLRLRGRSSLMKVSATTPTPTPTQHGGARRQVTPSMPSASS